MLTLIITMVLVQVLVIVYYVVKEELQEPFVFTSVDTLVTDDIDIMSVGEN